MPTPFHDSLKELRVLGEPTWDQLRHDAHEVHRMEGGRGVQRRGGGAVTFAIEP